MGEYKCVCDLAWHFTSMWPQPLLYSADIRPSKISTYKPCMCEASSQFLTKATGFWDVSVRLRSCTYGHPDALIFRGCVSISNPRSILSSSCCESLRLPSICLFRIYIKFQMEVHLHPAATRTPRGIRLNRRNRHYNKTLLCLTYSVNVAAHNLQHL